MGLLSQLFSKKKTESRDESKGVNFIWRTLEESSQLNAVETLSKEKIVVIFKHSVTCGISNMVWHQFQNEIDFNNDHIEMLYLDLLAHRDISNEITKRFKVLHQSPQILVIKDAEVLHHASHSAIRISNIKKYLPQQDD